MVAYLLMGHRGGLQVRASGAAQGASRDVAFLDQPIAIGLHRSVGEVVTEHAFGQLGLVNGLGGAWWRRLDRPSLTGQPAHMRYPCRGRTHPYIRRAKGLHTGPAPEG
jgi:hypothetical protein